MLRWPFERRKRNGNEKQRFKKIEKEYAPKRETELPEINRDENTYKAFRKINQAYCYIERINFLIAEKMKMMPIK